MHCPFAPGYLFLVLIAAVITHCAASDDDPRTSPSNATMPKGFRDNAYFFTTSQFVLTRAINLFPLTPGLLAKGHKCYSPLAHVTTSSISSFSADQIALVSCDPSDYQGNLDASYLLSRLTTGASTPKPCAIVLYSQESQHCNFTNQGDYDKVFTVQGSKDIDDLLRGASRSSSKLSSRSAHVSSIRPDPDSDVGKGAIDPQTGMLGAPGAFIGDDGGPAGGADGGGGGGGSGGGGSSNALIILYTITAIVTVLFLAVIVAGAVRAHRNPARYGPRAGMPNGRTRQTRAKGLARAMLETLPVVKFGDDEEWHERDVDHAKKDVEMADYDEETHKSGIFHQREDVDDTIREKATDDKTDRKEPRRADDDISMSSGQIKPVIADQSALSKEISTGNDDDNHETSQITLNSPQPNNITEDSSLVCPICTDDFKKGENLRVLPCRHRFHSDCVDPWLVNVSGTCPLCRVDLNPEEEAEEAAEAGAGAGPEGSGQARRAIGNVVQTDANGNVQEAQGGVTSHRRSRRHHRLTGLLHQSVEERIVALRRLRNHHVAAAAGGHGTAHEQRQHDRSTSHNVIASPQREQSQSQSQSQQQSQQSQQQQQQRPPSSSSSASSSASRFSRSMTHLPAPPPQSHQPSRPERSTVTGEGGTASDSASSFNEFDRRGGTGRRSRFKKRLRSTIGLPPSRSQR